MAERESRPAGAGGRTIALVGLRCSGKTSVGRRLAAALDRLFVDLDDVTFAWGRLEVPKVASVGELLARVGEETFRRIEAEALDDVLDKLPPCVLATGGGVVETPRARARLASEAVPIWRVAAPEELGRRLRADPASRPSLTGDDPADELAVLLKRRAPMYREVSLWRIDCGARGIEEIAEEIHTRLEESDPG